MDIMNIMVRFWEARESLLERVGVRDRWVD